MGRCGDLLGKGSGPGKAIRIHVLELVSSNQVRHIRRALEIYRTQYRNYPETLERLVDVGLLGARDLNFPWEEPFYYQVSANEYRLLRPLR